MTDTASNINILAILNCAISTNPTNHLCEDPIILSCGHYICKRCLKPNVNHNTIKCIHCNEMNKRDLSQEAKPQLFNIMLDSNLKTLFKLTFDTYKLNLNKWIQTVNETDERVDNHVEFLREEIQIQIESIKAKLDDLFDSFNKELDELKVKWKFEINNFNANKIDTDAHEKELDRLENLINKQQSLTTDNLYYYQNKLTQLQNVLNEYNDTSPRLKFMENGFNLNKGSIGRLVLKPEIECDQLLIAKIKEHNYESFHTGERIDDLCVLSNDNLLVTNYDHSGLNLYDSDFKFIKTIDSINGKKFKIMAIACYENEIYLSDFENHFVIKTDLEFNELAKFGNGIGCSVKQVNGPFGLCYFDFHVYVCDYSNRRIVKFDKDLNFVKSYSTFFKPCYVKAINSIAIVRQFDERSMYFYNLYNFNLIRRYDGHNGIIGVSQQCFYEYYQPTNKFYCYNNNGELVDQIETNGFGLTNTDFNGAIFIADRTRLYLANRGDRFINVFK